MAKSIRLSASSHTNAFCFSLLNWSCVSASIAGSVSMISRTICLSDEIPCCVGNALSPAYVGIQPCATFMKHRFFHVSVNTDRTVVPEVDHPSLLLASAGSSGIEASNANAGAQCVQPSRSSHCSRRRLTLSCRSKAAGSVKSWSRLEYMCEPPAMTSGLCWLDTVVVERFGVRVGRGQ